MSEHTRNAECSVCGVTAADLPNQPKEIEMHTETKSIIQTDYINRPVVATTAHGPVAGFVGHYGGNPKAGISLTTPDGAVFWPHEITDVRGCTKTEATRVMIRDGRYSTPSPAEL